MSTLKDRFSRRIVGSTHEADQLFEGRLDHNRRGIERRIDPVQKRCGIHEASFGFVEGWRVNAMDDVVPQHAVINEERD